MEAAKEIAKLKREESLRQHDADVRAAVEGVSVEGMVQKMSDLGLEISRALNGLSGALIDEVHRLTSVRQAVELEQKELQRLHKIDVGVTALDQLVRITAWNKSAWRPKSRPGARLGKRRRNEPTGSGKRMKKI